MVETGSERQAMLGRVALQWSEGRPQRSCAAELGVDVKTLRRYRDLLQAQGIEALTAGKPRTDLQTVASSLLAGDVNLDLDSIAQLCLGHLASLRADETADRSKAINDCIAMLYKCAEKKDSSGDKLGDALADAMKE
jgi:hypothetical protein